MFDMSPVCLRGGGWDQGAMYLYQGRKSLQQCIPYYVADDTTTTPTGGENPSLRHDNVKNNYYTGFRLWLVFIALALSVFLIGLDFTIVATAIPAITDEFHGIKDVAWYGPVLFLTVAGFQSAWGKIFKYFPLKASYLVAIFIFELGSLLCAVAPSSAAFIVGRAVAGVGGAGVASGAYTIVGFISEPQKRAAHTGIMGAVYGITNALGPVIGGAFSSTTTWRWCFYVNLPVGAVSIIAIAFYFKNPDAAKPQQAKFTQKLLQMDPAGTILIMGAVVSFIIAVQYGGQTQPWSSPTVIGLLVATGVIIVLFAAWEYLQGDRAMVVFRLLKHRAIFLSALYTMFLGGSFFIMVYYLPIYFQGVQGTTPVGSGVRNLPFILGSTLGSIASGLFISATGLSTPIVLAASVIGTIGCGLCLLLNVDTTTGKWVGYQLVAGLALGSGFQVPIIVGQASVDHVDISTVTAMLLFFQTVGGALFVSGAQAGFANRLLQVLPSSAPNVEPQQVLLVGANEIRNTFPAKDVPGIISSYREGLVVTYAIATAAAGVAFLSNVFLSWKRLDTSALKQAAGAA
ncbi:efflux pump antibiotic resistance protein [Nemania sp. FL0916]|nr:efflux pump antibiotic resistance protein [Nemania sp. FL0916]